MREFILIDSPPFAAIFRAVGARRTVDNDNQRHLDCGTAPVRGGNSIVAVDLLVNVTVRGWNAVDYSGRR